MDSMFSFEHLERENVGITRHRRLNPAWVQVGIACLLFWFGVGLWVYEVTK